MARDTAIAAVSNTLRAILDEARPDRFASVDVHLLMPRHFENGYILPNGTPNEGIGLLLYRIAVDTSQRATPPRLAPDGTRLRPSLPLNLHYLLACWAADVAKQQLLLGWAMSLLADLAILPASLLNNHSSGSDPFAASEGVELTADPLALADWLGLWDKLKPNLALGSTYTARGVSLDSSRVIDSAARVTTRRFRAGEALS